MIYPKSRPAGVTTRSPRMVTECLLTRSMLIKMYLPFHGMCRYMYIVFTVCQFHADVHSVHLVSQIESEIQYFKLHQRQARVGAYYTLKSLLNQIISL